jgi:hypothetical protein
MWALDETDTTMSQYKKEIKDNLRVGLKVGRALRVMVCYMCQSYLPSDIGLNHPDLKASATILLSTSAEEGADDLPMSKERRLEIKEEIAYLNAEGCKYFALVKYPGVQPFVSRLPKPKAYSHLQFESGANRVQMGSLGAEKSRLGAAAGAKAKPIQDKEFGDLGSSVLVSPKPDSGAVMSDPEPQKLGVDFGVSQSEIDRIIGLLRDGIKSQEKIVKSVWGVSRCTKKNSTYQKKVAIVKAIRAEVKRS